LRATLLTVPLARVESAALLARVLVAIVFATAAAAKLADRRGVLNTLAAFEVPATARGGVAVLLPLAELAAASALLVSASARWGAVGAIGLLVVFTAGVGVAMARGRKPDCHCFGRLSSSRAAPGTLVRNAVLAVAATLVAAYGPGDSIGEWLQKRSPAELVAVGASIAAMGFVGLCLRLRLEIRHLRRDLDRLEGSTAETTAGLPIGSPAPRFALPDVEGHTTTLEALLERGKPVGLVFVSANCGSCTTLLPNLARWQGTLQDRLTIAAVAAGSPSEVSRLAAQHRLENVLVQDDGEVFRAYHAVGTPSGVIVAADGSIASRTTATAFMVESLLRRALHSATTANGDGGASGGGPQLTVLQWSGPIGAR